MMEHLGIFDSGVGGLTVLRALIEQRAARRISYLGDTARVPYGTKSPESVRRYSRDNAQLLMSMGITHLVIACNTASAYALEELQKELPIPVSGVIEPGVSAALSVTCGRVGLLATPATVRSGKYQNALRREKGVEVFSVACPLFVPLAEEGYHEHLAAELIAHDYVTPLLEAQVDTVLLGCTHYPLLYPLLRRVLGSDIAIVDSAHACARLFASDAGAALPETAFYVSDDPEKFQELGQRFLGYPLGEVRCTAAQLQRS